MLKSDRSKLLLGGIALGRAEMPLELNPVDPLDDRTLNETQEFAKQQTLHDPFLTMKNTVSSTT